MCKGINYIIVSKSIKFTNIQYKNMATSKISIDKINTENFIPSFFILAFLIVGFIPNLGAVDKIAPQWLYLTIINISSALYIFYKKNYFSEAIIKIFSTGASVCYIFFFLWALGSYFYSINQTEALVNLARHANTLFMYLHLFVFIFNFNKKNVLISWVMSIILIIEAYSVFNQAMDMVEVYGSVLPGELKGVTANRNITAFSIALKIPFVLYLFEKSKNKIIIYLLGILIFFCFLDLTMISSRASFIAVGIIFIGYLLICLYKLKTTKSNNAGITTFLKIGFYIVPLILAIIINKGFIPSSGGDVISRAATISINTSDDSISKRLRYYEDVINHMTTNPIFGTGIGNWKLESIKYDRLDIDGYIVPYHAHSDFIQLGAELGIIGLILYLGIFLFTIYYVFLIIFKSNLSEDNKVFSFILLISLGVYLIDANLNFPIARPQELAPWAIVIALINFYYLKSNSSNLKRSQIIKSKKIKYVFPIITIMFSLPALSINNQTYRSQINQLVILNDFNNNTHNVPLNQIENFVSQIPNITVTTIPMDAIKARYYYHYKKYDKALQLLESSKSQNPYLSYSDALESMIYKEKGDLEKAKKSAEIAFYNLPKNNFHMSQYITILIDLKDEESLEKAYKLLTRNDNFNGWKNYLLAISNISKFGNPKYIKRADKALELFPSNQDFVVLHKLISIGKNNIEYAKSLSDQAQVFFNKNNFEEAAKLYEKAILIDPYEYSYYENASISYYSIKDYDNSLLRINEVVNNKNPLNGKCEYIKGLIYIQLGLVQDACTLFKTSMASGYSQSQQIINQYCSN